MDNQANNDTPKKSAFDEQIEKLKTLVKDFPDTSGVYLMKNDKETVIYVGKAKDLRSRVRSYLTQSKDHSVKTTYLVRRIETIDYILTDTEVEAFLLEASLIKKYKPRYNIRLKDDKNYPYIRCDMSHGFPRFNICRKVFRDKALYFGPYSSGFAVNETIDFINRTFKIRDCKDNDFKSRKRPCLTYEIGRCKAPCVKRVSEKEYQRDLGEALAFLRGENKKILDLLNNKMKAAAKEERFEVAAKLRDAMFAVEKIWEKQNVISANSRQDKDAFVFVGDHRGTLIESLHLRNGRVIGNRYTFIPRLNIDSPEEEVKDWLPSYLNQYYAENVIPDEILLPVDLGGDIVKLLTSVFKQLQGKESQIYFVPSGENNELIALAYKNAKAHFDVQVTKQENRLSGLTEIKNKFSLKEIPQRIECFDISTFQGGETVASQVVFEDGLPKKADYRRYKIKTVVGTDDFASMTEVLTRRFKHKEYEEPQLLLVDGGKGQLRMALEVLKDLNLEHIPCVGLAKARTKSEFKKEEVQQTEERFFLPGQSNYVLFKPASEAFQILVGLRDEAHRYAITYHRKLRNKRTLESELDSIVGLGTKRKQTLLKHFKGIDDIRSAKPEEIAALKTFNLVLAHRILQVLNEEESN